VSCIVSANVACDIFGVASQFCDEKHVDIAVIMLLSVKVLRVLTVLQVEQFVVEE
jgi:hypothetical protein